MADDKVQIKFNIEDTAAQRALKEFTKNLKGVENASGKATTSMSVFKGALGAAAIVEGVKAITSAAIALGRGVAGSIFEATKQVESLTTQFEVLTGSTATANALMKELQDFSARTPFQLEGISTAASQLIAFGFETSEVTDRLQEIGDVAAAAGQPMTDISLIYGQVAAAGKLTGERLLQLQERAVPIGPALAKTMGVAESSLRDLVSEGKVTDEVFQKAFASMSQEGGIAFQGMVKRSQTLEGRISTLQDNMTLLSANIGAKLAPAFKTAVTAVTEFIQKIQDNGALTRFIEDFASRIPNAIKITSEGLIAIISIFQAVRIAINEVSAFIAAFAKSAIDVVITLNEAEISVKRFMGASTEGLEQQNKSLRSLSQGLEEYGANNLAVNDQILTSTGSLIEGIQEGEKIIQALYKQESDAALAAASATEDATARKKAAKNAETEVDAQHLERLKALELEKDVSDEERRIAKNIAAEEQRDAEFIILQERLGHEAAIRRQAEMTILEGTTKAKELEVQTEIDANKKMLADYKKRVDEEEKADKEREKNKKNLYSNLTALARMGSKDMFETVKKVQTGVAIIDGLSAIQSALKAPPGFPYNIASVVAVTAQTAGNVAAIKSQGYEQGGIVPGTSYTGDNINARVNSREMILNQRQQGNLFRMANGANGVSGIIQINNVIELDGDVVARSVSRRVADGYQLGSNV